MGASGHSDRLIEDTSLGDGDAAGCFHSPAHKHIDELGAEVGLHSLEKLLAQHHIAAFHAYHIAVKQADVLGFVAFSDQRKEVEVGADAPTAKTLGTLAGHLYLGQVGIRGDALGGADCVEDGG